MRITSVLPPVEYSLRQLDIFTADLTAKSIWNPSVMGFGRVDDNDLKTLIVTYERQAESYAAIYPIYEGRVRFAQNTGSFLPIWVRSSTVSSIPDPEDEKPTPYHVEAPDDSGSETLEGIIAQLRPGDMPGSEGGLTLTTSGGEMDFVIPASVMADTLREGMIVRVTYHSQDGINTIERIEVTGNPSPDDTLRVTEGIVLRYDVAMEIVGQPPVVTLAIPGGEQAFSAPYGLPDALDVGAVAHVHYYVLDGVNIADDISIVTPPVPTPDDPPVPVPNPVPGPDPVDPVPAPVMAWVEGYVMMRLDDPAVLAPGQLRELTISAAGQDFALQIPEQMALPDDAQTGAFVHADYTAYQNGQNLVSSIYVMQPAPQPTDDPMPGPINDPMPGPIDEPMPGPMEPPMPGGIEG